MSVSSLQVRINNARANLRECQRGSVDGKWPKVICAHGSGHVNNCIVRQILIHIERDIAKVALVPDAISATNAGSSVSENIPGESNARREVFPIGLPELPDRTLRCKVEPPTSEVSAQV